MEPNYKCHVFSSSEIHFPVLRWTRKGARVDRLLKEPIVRVTERKTCNHIIHRDGIWCPSGSIVLEEKIEISSKDEIILSEKTRNSPH